MADGDKLTREEIIRRAEAKAVELKEQLVKSLAQPTVVSHDRRWAIYDLYHDELTVTGLQRDNELFKLERESDGNLRTVQTSNEVSQE